VPIKASITPDDAVDLLNNMLLRDPGATAILIGSRHQVNAAMDAHPTLITQETKEGVPTLGLLGVLNGLFGFDEVHQRGVIVAVYDDNDRLDRFVRGDD